jgi:hypothetical protein
MIARSTISGWLRPCSAGGNIAPWLHNPDLARRLSANWVKYLTPESRRQYRHSPTLGLDS